MARPPPTDVTASESVVGTNRRCWLTLFAFGYNAGVNAVLFMDFVVVSDLSAESFKVDPSKIAWTYSVGLLTVLPVSFLVPIFLPQHSYFVFGSSVVFDVLGAWLRWLSLVHRNWILCMASSVCIGVAFAICCMTYAVVADRWFPPEQQTLATSIGVQSNYAGWCIGAFLLPTVIHDYGSHEFFLLVQAVVVSLALVLFLLFHDERVAKPYEKCQPLTTSLMILATRPGYIVKLIPYATLGAVGYTIPAVQDILLGETLQVEPAFTKWTDTAFIATGVVVGLLFSIREPRRPRLVICANFVAAVLALALAAVLVSPVALDISNVLRRDLLLGAMAVAGGASLGFVGIALVEISHEVPEVSEVYTAGAVEWFIQAGGGIYSQVAVNIHGFQICGALVLAATVILLSGSLATRCRADELACASSSRSLLA